MAHNHDYFYSLVIEVIVIRAAKEGRRSATSSLLLLRLFPAVSSQGNVYVIQCLVCLLIPFIIHSAPPPQCPHNKAAFSQISECIQRSCCVLQERVWEVSSRPPETYKCRLVGGVEDCVSVSCFAALLSFPALEIAIDLGDLLFLFSGWTKWEHCAKCRLLETFADDAT